MRPIPPKLRKMIDEDPRFKYCERGGNCSGRLTVEHAISHYRNRQINELWAFVSLCWYHHLGKGLDKRWNEWKAINRMTKEDEKKYPRVDWEQKRKYLNSIYK